jgi:hypothetical protein
MVTLCYRYEVRPEAWDRAAIVFAQQRHVLVVRVAATLATAEVDGLLVRDGEKYRFARAITARRRFTLRTYFVWSKVRAVVRWPKYAITFEEWLPYIVRKLERRTGQPVRLTVLERRFPLIFLWPRIVHIILHRPAHERRVS